MIILKKREDEVDDSNAVFLLSQYGKDELIEKEKFNQV